MTTGAAFLGVSDIRGDLDYLAKVIELASRKDVGAQALFIHGNLSGPVIAADERAEYDAARAILQKELDYRPDYYVNLKVRDVAMLGHYMSMNPANYRRDGENKALKSLRSILGLRDTSGRFLEVGKAGMRVRRFYSEAEKLFKKCAVPVHAACDTPFAEDAIDPARWLHLAWASFSGFSLRCLPSVEGELPEVTLGMNRGGKPVLLEEYPIASGDIVFARSLNPFLDETLNRVPGKLVILCGDGAVDLSYQSTIVSAQKPLTAYFYRAEGARCTRRTYRYNTGTWAAPGPDDVAAAKAQGSTNTEKRRRTLEEQAQLASFGTELIQLVDLVRRENPVLAGEIEKSKNRVEAIMNYVREIENQRTRLADVISTQRAGIERLVRALDPVLGPERSLKAQELLNLPLDKQNDVPSIDAANVAVMALIAEVLLPSRVGGNGQP